jgi:hypothetical protein
MAITINAPSLSTNISYDFTYDKISAAYPAYWYALQFWEVDTNGSLGGYLGLQQYSQIVNNGNAVHFSQFGIDASSPIVGNGGVYLLSADYGSGVTTAIPFQITANVQYHIEIKLFDNYTTAYITDTSSNKQYFISSIYTPNNKGFTGAFLWEEQYTPAKTITDVANSQATFSNIIFDNNPAIFNPSDFVPYSSIGGQTSIEWVLIKTGNSFSIRTGTNINDVFKLPDIDTSIYLNPGNYTVIAGSGNNYISAMSGNTHLNGGSGNDTFISGSGNDVIDGGTGINTVIFSGNKSEYSISSSGNFTTVVDSIVGRNGSDKLSNIQYLQFKDQTVPNYITNNKNGFANNSYLFVSGYYTYDQALSAANTTIVNGVTGHLVTVESAAEESFLVAQCNKLSQSLWLGMSDNKTEGTWLYTAGPNVNNIDSYTDWHSGEPNGGRTENNVALWNVYGDKYAWIDVPANNLFGYVVEFEDTLNSPTINKISTVNKSQINIAGITAVNTSVDIYVDGNKVATANADQTGNFNITPLQTFASGTHQVTTTQTDAAGNVSALSNAISFTVDTVAPISPVLSANVGSLTKVTQPIITGKTEAGSSIALKSGA